MGEPRVLDEYNGALVRDDIQIHSRRRAADTVTAVPVCKAVVHLSMVVTAAKYAGLTCYLDVEKWALAGWTDLVP